MDSVRRDTARDSFRKRKRIRSSCEEENKELVSEKVAGSIQLN